MNSDFNERYVQALRAAYDTSASAAFTNLIGVSEALEWDGETETGSAEIATDLARVLRSLEGVAEHLCDNDVEHGSEAWHHFSEFLRYLGSDHRREE